MKTTCFFLTLFLAACSGEPSRAGANGETDAATGSSDVAAAADVDIDSERGEDTSEISDSGGDADVSYGVDVDAAMFDASDDTGAAMDAGGSVTLKVLTINLWNAWANSDDYELRTEMVAQFIDDRRPDFVAVQEAVATDDIENRVDVLARMTGYTGVYEKTHDVPFTFEEGIGVLSRRPISTSDATELRHGDLFGATQRKVLGASVDVDGISVWMFSTHLIVEQDQDKKSDQAFDVFEFMGEKTAGVAFLAGDMNATPDTTAMSFLRGDAEVDGVLGDLSDAWLATNPAADGFTHPSDAPDKRIDYVYGRGAVPTDCERVLDVPQGDVYASDHVGVICTFALR